MAKSKKALGKGLEALIGSSFEDKRAIPSKDRGFLPIDEIKPSSFQPRQSINDEGLTSLAESIKEHGILQPLIVRRAGEGYEVVAGERRWKAAKIARLKEVPVVIVDLDDAQSLEVALVENLQREDLSPIEVAKSLSEMIKRFDMTHEEVASRLGWSRPLVSNKLRLLDLPVEVQKLLEEGKISEGHARALSGLSSGDDQTLLARKCVAHSWSVRRLEDEINRLKASGDARRKKTSTVELPLGKSHGLKVVVKKSQDESRLIIGGLDDKRVERLVKFLEENIDSLFDRGV
ncbi:MAG: ParB/RepB/Spo0J family partition protein [Acetomicrobium sp.]